jgi:hypothetical protein
MDLSTIPTVTCDNLGVPIVFQKNCGTWEGTARRINPTGEQIDEQLVRVKIEIDRLQYVQTNTVRIGTPREVVAQYFGDFRDQKLVFPLTDEVYTLGGEKATAFSGIAWAVTDDIILYCGSRTLRAGVETSYNEIITIVTPDHRVRTTQLFENGAYQLVTLIDEIKVA